MAEETGLIEALAIQPGDLVALVGGGGKSSLLFALGRAWPGRAVLTSTTRLARDQVALAPVWLGLADLADDRVDRLGLALAATGVCLILGEPDGDKLLGVPPDRPAGWLARPEVDLVVVEADGARLQPVKAPAPHEPVIPPETTLVVVVAGLDALKAPLSQCAHRPERLARLLDLSPDDQLTPVTLARLLTHAGGGLQGVPATARVVICLNKADTRADRRRAVQTSRFLCRADRVQRVVVTTLWPAPRVVAGPFSRSGLEPGRHS